MADVEGELIACHECDGLHWHTRVPAGGRADCRNCGATLYRAIPDSLDRSLALFASAFVLLLIANSFPFLTLEFGGRVESSRLISGSWALYQMGMGELGLLVFATSILFPLLTIGGMLYLLLTARFGQLPPGMGWVWRMVNGLMPWSLLGVFLLGTLVAVVKLQDMADVIPGIALFAFIGAMLAYAGGRANFEPRELWKLSPVRQLDATVIRSGRAVLGCHTCGLLRPRDSGLSHCPRCGSGLHYRKSNSLQRTWALLVAAAVLFIPANLYPIMEVIQFGRGSPDTILSGVTKLIGAGMWGLGLLVFFVSIVVPLAKLTSLVWLLRSVEKRSNWNPKDRTRLYRVTEMVGSWSMVDVFLVGLLTGLVSLDVLATIRPGIGATFFAGVVILTMFAAMSFDPRLIWDHSNEDRSNGGRSNGGRSNGGRSNREQKAEPERPGGVHA